MTSCRLLPRAGPDQEKKQGPSRAVPVTNQGGGKRERRACIPEKEYAVRLVILSGFL